MLLSILMVLLFSCATIALGYLGGEMLKRWGLRRVLAVVAAALFVNSAALAADYTSVGNVTDAITNAVTTTTGVFWSLVTLSVAAIIVALIFRFTRKGTR